MGGLISSPYSGGWNNIDYITIASFGESIDFGDLSFDNPGGLFRQIHQLVEYLQEDLHL